MMYGHTIGPRAVVLHDKPVAIRRLFLKYVFRANAFDDWVIPIPDPKKILINHQGS